MDYIASWKSKSPERNPVNSKKFPSKKSARQGDAPVSSPRRKKQSSWYEKLKKEQRDAADFVFARGSVALFSQQRTGKTYITMAVLEKLNWPDALIVAPLTSIDLVWVPALEQSPYRICRSAEELAEASGARVLVLHYQAWEKASKKLAKLPWELVCIDESQGLKARNSKQSRAARRFRHVPRRLALSGTPMDEKPIDVWAQMRFVNHEVLGENWTAFAEEYCYRSGFMGHEWKFNPRKHDEFVQKLSPYVYRLTVGFLNLKPIVLHPIPFALLGDQQRIYKQMRDHNVIKLGHTTITAPLTVTSRTKLEQITGGRVLDEEDIPRFVGRAKERKLGVLISKLKPPLVVFCNFRHEIPIINRILRKFFRRIACLHGGIKDTKKGKFRTDLVRDFQAGKLDALVCQLRTGGVSIDLTRSSELIFYSINHSYIDFEQVLFRLYGMNQKRVLNVYILFAVDTVDEEKVQVIENKKSEVYKVISHFERS